MRKALQKDIISFVHFDIFRGRLDDERFTEDDHSAAKKNRIIVARIGKHAGQFAVIFSVQGIEDQIPIAGVDVVFGKKSPSRVIELKHLIVRGEKEAFVIIQTMQFPADLEEFRGEEKSETIDVDQVNIYTSFIAVGQTHEGTSGYHSFARSWGDWIENDSIFIPHVETRIGSSIHRCH